MLKEQKIEMDDGALITEAFLFSLWRIKSVSYTHLDVYKRQDYDRHET